MWCRIHPIHRNKTPMLDKPVVWESIYRKLYTCLGLPLRASKRNRPLHTSRCQITCFPKRTCLQLAFGREPRTTPKEGTQAPAQTGVLGAYEQNPPQFFAVSGGKIRLGSESHVQKRQMGAFVEVTAWWLLRETKGKPSISLKKTHPNIQLTANRIRACQQPIDQAKHPRLGSSESPQLLNPFLFFGGVLMVLYRCL